jgi:hypothetical protein
MFSSIKEFTADQFKPTKWEASDKKAKFAKQFIKFVQSDFAKSQFPHTFYVRLALCFGHIAHYDIHGFYREFFTTTEDKVRFIRQTLQHPCWGEATYTYSDVERALQAWLHQNDILTKYEQRLSQEQEANEKTDLARLQAKYGKQPE